MWAQFHTLVTHELKAILELLAFVVARKRLKPDLAVFDVLLLVDGQISTRLFFKPLLGTQTQIVNTDVWHFASLQPSPGLGRYSSTSSWDLASYFLRVGIG